VSSSRPPVARPSALTVAALALAALAAAVLTIAGAHIRPSGQGHVPSGGSGDGPAPTRFIQQPSASATPKRVKPSRATDLAGLFLFVLGVLGVVIGLVVLVAVLRSVIYRRRLAKVRHRAPPHADEDAAPDLTRTLRAAVDEALDELGSGGPVADAIIACWLRLQAASSDAGIAPVASDTAEEAIERVFAVRTVRPAPLRALAELYREARFSGHRMAAADADAARAALREVLADLAGASAQAHAAG
jgi:hypothetical protein